jgi:hypothetical protein
MSTPARTTQVSGIYETLGQLIQNPKSLGLREQLPPRVLAVLTRTRELLREEMNGRAPIAGGENDLAAELSQDADTQHGFPQQEQNRMSFSRLLCRQMEQRHLSNYDVAVSLGCSIQHVCDLITGVREPTELHIAELALLFGVTQESLATAAKPTMDRLAATV